MIGYRLKESFLETILIEYDFLKSNGFKYSFQQLIEACYGSTMHLESFFLKHELPFNIQVCNSLDKNQRFKICNESILISYKKIDLKPTSNF